jgi:hypothetical protein
VPVHRSAWASIPVASVERRARTAAARTIRRSQHEKQRDMNTNTGSTPNSVFFSSIGASRASSSSSTRACRPPRRQHHQYLGFPALVVGLGYNDESSDYPCVSGRCEENVGSVFEVDWFRDICKNQVTVNSNTRPALDKQY